VTLRAPVRIDLLAGWSDQPSWPGPAAVLNASVTFGDGYPLEFGEDGWRSEISGIGTGLGAHERNPRRLAGRAWSA
jgi:hypothetical protein